MNKKKLIFRIIFYCSGAFFTALGVVITINANLGVSPVTSLPYVLSLVTNIDVGICFMAFFALIITIQIAILRKNFKLINLTQIIISTLFGYFVILAEFIVGDFVLPTYPGRLLMLLSGIFFVALGITLYVDAKLVPMPVEGLANAIMQKLKRPFYQMKLTVDCSTVLCSVIISFIVFGRLHGLREGTIISAVLIGWMIKIVQKAIHPIMDKLCFDQTEPDKL
jgi:uncharacterized membrane protein YczE